MKPTHEELCNLWAQARKAKLSESPWLNSYRNITWYYLIPLRDMVQVFYEEMNDLYGDDGEDEK